MYDKRRDPVSLVTSELHATEPEEYDHQRPTKEPEWPDRSVILLGDVYILKHIFRSIRFGLKIWPKEPTPYGSVVSRACVDKSTLGETTQQTERHPDAQIDPCLLYVGVLSEHQIEK